MAARSDRDELMEAWRALAGQASGAGWRTISVCAGRPTRFLAGRSASDDEALFVEVGPVPGGVQLPVARGFQLERVAVAPQGPRWLALTRRPGGNLDLFTAMAEDVVATIDRRASFTAVLHVLLDRVRAWQAFMDQEGSGLLSSEREVGLFGELHVLTEALRAGVPATTACDGWKGPTGSQQDFLLGSGGVEVKSSVATGEFPAHISSLDQLDDQAVRPLFVAAVRLSLAADGNTLPAQVASVRALLNPEPAGLALFEDRLLRAGFVDAHSGHYARSFLVTNVRTFPVGASFPRLVRSSVPAAILSAKYVVDLDAVGIVPVTLIDALKSLGVT